MRLRTASYRRLSGDDRLTAHVAARARLDTIYGGCKALVLAKRLKRMKGTDVDHIIGDVYASSTGEFSHKHEGWECPECGQAHLGQEAAFKCCQQGEE